MPTEMNQSQTDVTPSHTVKFKRSGSLRKAEWDGGCKKQRPESISPWSLCRGIDCKQPGPGSENPAGPLQEQ